MTEIDLEKVMDDAMDLIQKGWCQKAQATYTPSGMQYCFVGSMVEAFPRSFSTYDIEWIQLIRLAQDTVRSEVGHPSIPDFNDDDKTSKEDVLLMMKKVKENIHADRC